jgi:galactokinase
MQQQAIMVATVANVFKQHFSTVPLIASAPGRINLIGEHTDYNNGYVLPAAIDKAAYIGIQKRTDDVIHLYAIDMDEHFITSVQVLNKIAFHWSGYVLGIVDQLKKMGASITGFNAVLTCNVPIGGGMSSSAAVECATIFALNQLFQLQLQRLAMVKLAQQAENQFVGVKCGIMDMFASIMGKKNHVIQLDCSNLQHTYFPLALQNYKMVLFDTQVKHSLASGEYNIRRQQCETGVNALQQKFPHINSLRDVSIEMLDDAFIKQVGLVVYHRCLYIVQEIARVAAACIDLQNNDLVSFGKKMYATHYGLSTMYQVSCTELDLLVNLAKSETTILGARMMGGGFGGCTINLIQQNAIDDIYERWAKKFEAQTGKQLKMYITTPQDGAKIEVN